MPSSFVEMEVSLAFCPAGLLISASQVAGITGMSHHTWPYFIMFLIIKAKYISTTGKKKNKNRGPRNFTKYKS
jgi:hypothetical protein